MTAALEGLGGTPVDALVVAATAALGGRALAELVERAAGLLDGAAWAGAGCQGLLLGDREIVGLPGLAVVAFSGVRAEAFHCEALAGREAEVGEEIAGQISGEPAPEDLLVVFADSLNLAPAPLLRGLAGVAGSAAVVGLGASELPGDGPRTWAGGPPAEAGLSGLWLRAPTAPRLSVTDGSRALGEEMEVTQVRGHWVLGLDGGPALKRLEAAAGDPGREFPARGVVARIRKPGDASAPGAHVLRNLTGFDPDRGGFALALPPEPGDRLDFVRLDSVAARDDLAASLAGLDSGPAGLGLYFSCHSRGERLFEHPGLESGYLARALRGAPLLGMMGAFQLAPDPRGGELLLHTYAGVLARFDA